MSSSLVAIIIDIGMFPFWFLVFLVSIYISALIPGRLIISKTKLSLGLSHLLLSLAVGIVLLGIQGYIFGYLHLRFLTYLYVIGCFVIAVKHRQFLFEYLRDALCEIRQIDYIVRWIILGGIVIQMIPIFGSGLRLLDGIAFFGISRYDGVMHLSFIQSITASFPPIQPGAFGNLITNYHYWSDLIIAEIARVWHIPIQYLFFQFFPLLLCAMTGLLVYFIFQQLTASKTVIRWGMFLLFFSADAPFLFTLLLHRNFGFETPAIDNAATQFLNMPHGMAKAILAAGIFSFLHWLENQSTRSYGITILFFVPLVGIKIYFGIFAFVGLFFCLLGVLIRDVLAGKHSLFRNTVYAIEQRKYVFLLTIFAVFCAAIIFFPVNKTAGGLYLAPLEWPKLILGSSSLNVLPWWAAMRYALENNQPLITIVLDIVAIGITLVTIYGTRILGFIPDRRLLKTLGLPGLLFFIPGVIGFNMLGLFTLQVSGSYNVFNFFAVSAFILVFFAAFTIERILSGFSRYKVFLAVIVIALTVPRILFETATHLSYYFLHEHSYLVTNDDLEAYRYIHSHGENDVLVQSHPKYLIDMRVPYTAFFSGRYTYLTGIEAQETHNQPIGQRKNDLTQILFRAPNSYDFADKLEKRKIRYVFLHKNNDEQLFFTPTDGHYKIFFENESVIVLEPR